MKRTTNEPRKRVNLTLPLSAALRIRREVARRGTRLSAFVLAAVAAYMEKKPQGEQA
jgi:hypothetical protein